MALVFKVGDYDQMVPLPEDFPRCSNYMPDKNISPEHSAESSSATFYSRWHTLVVIGLLLATLSVNSFSIVQM